MSVGPLLSIVMYQYLNLSTHTRSAPLCIFPASERIEKSKMKKRHHHYTHSTLAHTPFQGAVSTPGANGCDPYRHSQHSLFAPSSLSMCTANSPHSLLRPTRESPCVRATLATLVVPPQQIPLSGCTTLATLDRTFGVGV